MKHEVMTISKIAKEFGMTGEELNEFLCNKGIIFRTRKGSTNRVDLCNKYEDKGYATRRTWTNKNNKICEAHYLIWTEKGKGFIHGLLVGGGLIK